MARDLGVQADYVDRAFRKLEDQVFGSAEERKRREAQLRAEQWCRDVEALALLQASRPKKPPGR